MILEFKVNCIIHLSYKSCKHEDAFQLFDKSPERKSSLSFSKCILLINHASRVVSSGMGKEPFSHNVVILSSLETKKNHSSSRIMYQTSLSKVPRDLSSSVLGVSSFLGSSFFSSTLVSTCSTLFSSFANNSGFSSIGAGPSLVLGSLAQFPMSRNKMLLLTDLGE